MPPILLQTGAIPYRVTSAGVEVLLVTAWRSWRWQLPKGMRMAGLTPAQAAEQEVIEEAGALGVIHERPVASYFHLKGGKLLSEVLLYPLEVHEILPEESWQEAEFRQRRWMSLPEAIARVEDAGVKDALRRFGDWAARLQAAATGAEE